MKEPCSWGGDHAFMRSAQHDLWTGSICYCIKKALLVHFPSRKSQLRRADWVIDHHGRKIMSFPQVKWNIFSSALLFWICTQVGDYCSNWAISRPKKLLDHFNLILFHFWGWPYLRIGLVGQLVNENKAINWAYNNLKKIYYACSEHNWTWPLTSSFLQK